MASGTSIHQLPLYPQIHFHNIPDTISLPDLYITVYLKRNFIFGCTLRQGKWSYRIHLFIRCTRNTHIPWD